MTTLYYLHWGQIEQDKVSIEATTDEACNNIPDPNTLRGNGLKKVLTPRGTTIKRRGSILRP